MMMIDVGRADSLAQQLLEKIGFFIGGARRADAPNRGRAMLAGNGAQARSQHINSLVPGSRLELSLLANQGCAQALRVVDKFEAPAPAVAQPAIVDSIIGA